MKDERRHQLPVAEKKRELLRDLLRNGHVEIDQASDADLDGLTRPVETGGPPAGTTHDSGKRGRLFAFLAWVWRF